MRHDKRQLTLEEGQIRDQLLAEDPGLRGFGLLLAIAAVIDRRRTIEHDKSTRRDDPRQCALAL